MELSSLLVRNVNYEIPSLKKQIAKCQQLQQEFSRKEEEGQAGATEMREQFYHLCKQYGITVSGGLTDLGRHLGPLPVFWALHLCIWVPFSACLRPFLSQLLSCLQFLHVSFNLLDSASHRSVLAHFFDPL